MTTSPQPTTSPVVKGAQKLEQRLRDVENMANNVCSLTNDLETRLIAVDVPEKAPVVEAVPRAAFLDNLFDRLDSMAQVLDSTHSTLARLKEELLVE